MFTDAMLLSSGSAKTYATWNPNDKGTGVTLSNGNLSANGGTVNDMVRSTIGKSSGKWYWEIKSGASFFGIANSSATLSNFLGATSGGAGYYSGNGDKYVNGAAGASFGTAYATGIIMGVALDMDGGTCKIYNAGTLVGTIEASLTGTYYAACGSSTGNGSIWVANFGASPFTYAVPSGYNSGLY